MASQPLRIVHCLRAPVGGLFRHVCDLAEAQSARGHEIGIIADSSTGGSRAAERLAELEKVCRLGIERFAMARLPGPGDLAVAAKVREVARRWDPDVLHGHGAKGGAYARLAGTRLRRGRRPVRAYTPHGGSLHFRKSSPVGFLFLAFERYLARRTDVFLFESEYGRGIFSEKVGEPTGVVEVVHNGMAEAEFDKVVPDPDAADFLFVGELRALKGIDTLLNALALLSSPSGGPSAVIVGAGADAATLVQLSRDLDLGGRVTFPGPMPARGAFALGKCIVVPSRAESLPYIVLEAAAARVPVIATNVGGIPEIFGSQAERLVPPDDPAALAAALERFLADPEGARDDANKLASDIAERFSVDGMADRILEAYYSAL